MAQKQINISVINKFYNNTDNLKIILILIMKTQQVYNIII